MTFACCVPGCVENGKRILHSFPKNQDQCEKWIVATKSFFLNKETAYQTFYKVCRKHFQPTDFKSSNLLNKNVVPSLMLPHPIIMEHNYCIRNSIFISSTVTNTLRGEADNRFSMEFEESKDLMENDFALENQMDVAVVEDAAKSISGSVNESIATIATHQASCLSQDHTTDVSMEVQNSNDFKVLNILPILPEKHVNVNKYSVEHEMVEGNSTDDPKPNVPESFSGARVQE